MNQSIVASLSSNWSPHRLRFLAHEGDYRHTLSSTRFVETTFVPFQPSNAPVPLMTLRLRILHWDIIWPIPTVKYIPVPLTILRVLHRDILLSHSTIFAHQFSRRHSRGETRLHLDLSPVPCGLKDLVRAQNTLSTINVRLTNLPNHTAFIHPNYSQPKLTLHAPHHTSWPYSAICTHHPS